MHEVRASLPPPDTVAARHSARVVAALEAEIAAAGGWLPFDRYMDLALFAPGLGYYAAGARKFGDAASGGDFVTAPEISPLFAAALAAQLAQVFKTVPARICEFGAGSGALARDLLAALEEHGIAADYSIVELSPDLMQRQSARLHGRGVQWLTAPPTGFEGVLLANEVLDVMPVKLFVKRRGRTLERGVGFESGRLGFDARPAGEQLATAVAAIDDEVGGLPDGYASEVGLVAASWMRSLAQWLARGVAFVVDYGFPRREYYHPQRLMGTLMCHYRHRAHADPLFLPGLNDITAHVDYSAAADAAHSDGLDVLGYTSQAHFLINCGVLDLLARSHDPVRANAAHRLISEAEMGELFKVLAVGRAVDEPLAGFVRGDRRHTL